MNEKQLAQQLQQYVPKGTAPLLAKWVIHYTVNLKITPPRSSKLGDYRPPQRGQGHRISINGSLNPFAFLITFVHEVAHLVTWNEYQHRVQPHGIEWKQNFKKLMNGFLTERVFPKDILTALRNYMRNPAASSCTDSRLQKILANYDPNHESRNWDYLEEIPTGTFFVIENGRVFQKMEKLRKNFKCIEQPSKREFRISPLMKVQAIKDAAYKEKLAHLKQHTPTSIADTWVHLEELQKGDFFMIEDGRTFQKMDKLRKNFDCIEQQSKEVYRVPPKMKVKKVSLT